MKKLCLVLAAVITAGLSAGAFVDTQYMKTPEYLQNTGYSAEMSRMMAFTNQDPYREPYVEGNSFKSILKRGYSYIAPTMNTDLDYYNHNGDFNNTSWKDF